MASNQLESGSISNQLDNGSISNQLDNGSIKESNFFLKIYSNIHLILRSKISEDIISAVSAYNNVLSMDSSLIGFVLLAATFLHPNIAFSGVIAVASSSIFFIMLGKNKHVGVKGLYFFNSLLVGLFIGYIFKLDGAVALLIVCSSCLTLLLTFFFDAIFKPLGLPLLSLPFFIVSANLALSAKNFTNLGDAIPYFVTNSEAFWHKVPPLYTAFLNSLGLIFCIPDPIMGLIIVISVLVYSPMAVLFLAAGFFEGYFAESYFTFSPVDLQNVHHYFNYSLIFLVIAGVFLTPSLTSIFFAMLGTLLATLVSSSSLAFWSVFHIPILSLPFNVIVILFILTMRSVNPEMLGSFYLGTPERTLDLSLFKKRRYGGDEIGIFCPFEGLWTVFQGFDGEWTHQGNWKHALDFVVTDHNGKTYRNQGIELEDYYAFGQPIFAPVEGYVVNLVSSLPDHPIGQVDNQNNWGNFILLRSLGGIYVLLAHLKKGSIEVKVGDHVYLGKEIGKCGNSGYSPEPHLHLHVQLFLPIGSYTTPFHLLNYKSEGKFHFYGLPRKGNKIRPLSHNRALDPKLVFRIGETLRFELRKKSKIHDVIEFRHELDPYTGIYYWTDGKSRMNYARQGFVFYFYSLTGAKFSPLWDLFLALPMIPITYGESFQFQDFFPLEISDSKWNGWIKLIWQIISGSKIHQPAQYEMDPAQLKISGRAKVCGVQENTMIKLDPIQGIQEFQVGSRYYKRIN